ncbi:hypothetical protein K7432_001093 [Basidiobolus ranarum]|uniref:Insecticide toxin TcdB middle/N-terminal domain-containing protein n=1 Tax=Basidiobolus ranarum TaxID=34480 RepID=A0ABR2X3P5_9FUNG
MEDANYEAAIGRLTGNFQVDANELSRYSYKIEVPSGIGYGNEPEISLEYSQGSSNGILGQGWSLAGLSSILKCPASLPFDGVNNPQGYDRSKLRLSLDGNELLNVKGEYFAVDAVYKHEISEPGRSVTCLGDGFVARDAAGIKIEYGTSEDSRSVSSDNHTTKEWHIKRQIDIHGNYVSYNYVTSLSTGAKESSETADVNVRYIDSIVYTSNEITGYQGKRFVKFEYATRTDPVTQIFLGEKRTYAHLLSAIHIGVKLEDVDYIIRSYKLNYVISGVTGSTCLSKITECSSLDKNKQSSLMPTVFNYTGKVLQPNELFTTGSEGTTSLFQTRNNVALMPMNISGRSMTDLACIRYDKDSQNMSVKTFLAFQQAEKHEGVCTIKWKASQGSGSEASLPSIEIGEDKPTPNFLSADLNGDGRMDLIIPFRGSDGNLSFSISQSTGTGFLDYTVKPTNITWSDESKFLATDLEGRGRTDIIQIFSQNKYLAFRIFRALNERGKGALADGKLTRVDYDFTTTLSWLELDMYRDGSKCIVRIWAEEQQRGDSMLKATTFALRHVSGSNDTKFEETSTSNIGKYSRDDQKKVSVLTCDINGDGVQDIVTCLVNIESEGPDNFMTFTFTTFLNDGFGGFLPHGAAIQRRFEIPSKGLPLNDGSFHVTSLYGSEYPCLAYVYQETKSRDFVALVAQGSCTGFVGELKYCKLAGHDDLPPLGDIQVTSADLNGTGLGGWLMYSLTNDTFDITSVYNRGSMADLLSSARDPIGKLTKVSYLPMSNSEVYKPSVAWDEYPPVAGAVDYPILAAPTYVVSEVKVTNDPTVNNLPFSSGYIKTYYGAKVNSKGRGWQSFSHMDTYDTSSNITTSEEFHQEWPFTGLKRKEETRSGRRKNGILVHSEESKYNRVFTEEAVWKIFHLNKKSERRNIIESDVTVRSTEVSYEYDNNGNMILECSNSDSGSQLWTRYLYTSINGMTGLPTAKKVSSRDSNRDMEVFEEGDLGLRMSSIILRPAHLRP